MKSPGLTIEMEDRNGIRLFHVAGPLDSMTHEEFRNQMEPMVNQPRIRIVLDCDKMTYINSRGLTLLAHYQRVAAANLSFFGVAGLNSRVSKAIELLGMDKVVKLYPSVPAALDAASVLG